MAQFYDFFFNAVSVVPVGYLLTIALLDNKNRNLEKFNCFFFFFLLIIFLQNGGKYSPDALECEIILPLLLLYILFIYLWLEIKAPK